MLNDYTVRIFVTRQKGGSYYGAADKAISVTFAPLVAEWLNNTVHSDDFHERKVARDGTSDLHITVIDPKETRMLRKSGVDIDSVFNQGFMATAHGVGRVVDGDNEAWFVAVTSPDLQKVRVELGLPEKAFHATLGFAKKDIFTVPKTSDTIVYPA